MIPTPTPESESSFDSDSGVGIAPGLPLSKLSAKYQFCAINTADTTDLW